MGKIKEYDYWEIKEMGEYFLTHSALDTMGYYELDYETLHDLRKWLDRHEKDRKNLIADYLTNHSVEAGKRTFRMSPDLLKKIFCEVYGISLNEYKKNRKAS